MAVCFELGVDRERIISGISSYTGVRRRFDIRIRTSNQVFIDDYAHHPAELEAFITAVRQLYPDKRITGLFQPHLYSRTRDFAEGFARSLDLLDEIWLLDIYPARETPIKGVTSRIIYDRIRQQNKKVLTREEVLTLITREKPPVFLTMGAGDIDLLVEPIEKILQG
jgi:UDP-N-acetylmuramate--alanine ligase